MRFFNTAGPMIADDHYLVPPLSRVDLDSLLQLIDQPSRSAHLVFGPVPQPDQAIANWFGVAPASTYLPT